MFVLKIDFMDRKNDFVAICLQARAIENVDLCIFTKTQGYIGVLLCAIFHLAIV
jgi:hypothetical protein